MKLVKSGQVKSRQFKSGQVKKDWPCQDRSSRYNMLTCKKSSLDESGTGQSNSGLIKSCQDRSNQFGSWERSSLAGTGQVIYGKVKLDRGQKIFWTSTFLGPNLFLNQKFLLDQFFGPIFTQNLY